MGPVINATVPVSPPESGERSLRRGFRGLSINLTRAERLGRVIVGVAGAAAGAVLLASATSALGAVLSVLLTASGIDLVITGVLGHCPLYSRIHNVPASLRSAK